MTFTLSGRVLERESSRGVAGLRVRPFDADLLYDDLLGSALTSGDGGFAMSYGERDFPELFERRPTIYLSVESPAGRPLLDTTASVEWGRSEHERLECEIERDLLRELSPSRQSGVIEDGVRFNARAATVERRGGFHVVRLDGFATLSGPPGTPAVPEQARYVVLPAGAVVRGVEVDAGEPLVLARSVRPLPLQPTVWDVDTERGAGLSPDGGRFSFVPLDERWSRHPYPEALVTLGGIEHVGGVDVAVVRLRPVQYDPAKEAFVCFPQLRYTLRYEPPPLTEVPPAAGTGRGRPMATAGLRALLEHAMVKVTPEAAHIVPAIVTGGAPYVIITDNFAWPQSMPRLEIGQETTRPPTLAERGTPLAGDLVAQFERLAKWKTSRGTRTRVVTTSEIVSQALGDFTENGFARDLQEVIRNFIKHVHAEWGTEYVLLGGDVTVVPIRQLAFYVSQPWHAWDASRAPKDPAKPVPDKRRCYIEGSVAKIHLDSDLTGFPSTDQPLYTQGGARLVFFEEASSASPGWYYVAEEEFSKNANFTPLPAGTTSEYVIVAGPANVIDDDYYWLGPNRRAPSDLYYASVAGPQYGKPGVHDFDPRGYRVYGQHRWDPNVEREVSLDGSFHVMADVSVGRAPVETELEAATFVDKVLSYERLEMPFGGEVNFSYLRRIVFGAAYLLHEHLYSQTIEAGAPTAGHFTPVEGTDRINIHIQGDVAGELQKANIPEDGPNFRLVARFPEAEIEVPYDADALSLPSWHFATDATFGQTEKAKATSFVVVLGLDTPAVPSSFFWDPLWVELGAAQKENQRKLLATSFPAFSEAERFYKDHFELVAPPPIQPLDAPTIRAAIDDGCHFLSLTGHGGPGGCCDVSVWPFQNLGRYFIAFADACSTASPDEGDDSLGESVLKLPGGGGVGYVGHTRMSAVGVGDDYEATFWCALRFFGRLGPAAGLRPPSQPVQMMTHNFIQILYGDPEMPIWTNVPDEYQVVHPTEVSLGGILEVLVLRGGEPLAGQQVTLMAGWTNSSVRPTIWRTKRTKSTGRVSFKMPSVGAAMSMTLTIVPSDDAQGTHQRPNFKPYVGQVMLTA